MNIRLYHANIITLEEGCVPFRGEVWVKNGKIAMVLSEEEVQRNLFDFSTEVFHWDLEIDCNDDLLMPGFKNCHTHSGMTFLRSFADDLPLQEWLTTKIFPNEAKLSPEDIYELDKLAILEYISGGTTCVNDMYLVPDSMARACIDMGFRAVITSGLNNFTSSPERMVEEYDRLNALHPLIRYTLGFHAEYTCEEELLKTIAKLADERKAPVNCHLAETKKEIKACLEKYGKTPAAYLNTLGMFDYGGTVYHGIYFTDEEMELLSEKNVSVVTNPSSNLKLASGIASYEKLVSSGINVAIGTDGPSSNNCLDMFREMFLVSGLWKVTTENASLGKADQILRMATVNGAKACNLPDCDTISRGKAADLILIDLHKPNMQPINDVMANLVYSGNRSDVRLTMVDGKVLYKDGTYFVGEDPEAIFAKCQKITDRILRG